MHLSPVFCLWECYHSRLPVLLLQLLASFTSLWLSIVINSITTTLLMHHCNLPVFFNVHVQLNFFNLIFSSRLLCLANYIRQACVPFMLPWQPHPHDTFTSHSLHKSINAIQNLPQTIWGFIMKHTYNQWTEETNTSVYIMSLCWLKYYVSCNIWFNGELVWSRRSV